MYRFPYRRAFKAADGSVMIELLDRTEIPLSEWQGNPAYRVAVDVRDFDPITEKWDEPQAEEPSFEDAR